MDVPNRIFIFVTRTNWLLFFLLSLLGVLLLPADYARGIVCGGILATVNFHLLSRTLKKALTPPHLAPRKAVLVKYYIRFMVSGIIIFVLIKTHWVHPIGLLVGLSVVVISILAATACEIKKLLFKEAT